MVEEDWLSKLDSECKARNAYIISSDLCVGCLERKKLDRIIFLDVKSKYKGKDYSGICSFICENCFLIQTSGQIYKNVVRLQEEFNVG